MKEVFADTVYFLGLLNPHDQYHTRAVNASRAIQARIVTTRWVLTEVGDALSAAPVRNRAFQFIRDLAGNRAVQIVNDSDSGFEAGLANYGRHVDKDWSLTDCISFALMHARGIREALTADHHFKQAGFIALLD